MCDLQAPSPSTDLAPSLQSERRRSVHRRPKRSGVRLSSERRFQLRRSALIRLGTLFVAFLRLWLGSLSNISLHYSGQQTSSR